MTKATSANNGVFQVNPDDLLSSSPQFYAASDAIREAATTLSSAVTKAISAFDGDTHKKLQTLGDGCVTNLQGLSNALEEIAGHLSLSSQATTNTEAHSAKSFK